MFRQCNDINAYSKEFIAEFLHLYESLPSTWDIYSQEYRNREKKSNDYKKLVKKWQEVEPSADRAFVVRKINWLRNAYRRDLSRVRKGTSPLVWYFHHMQFLPELGLNCKESLKAETDNEEDAVEHDPLEMKRLTSPLPATLPGQPQSTSPLQIAPSSPSMSDAPLNSKQEDNISQYNEPGQIAQILEAKQIELDRFEYMTRTWIAILKSIPRQQQLLAEKLINDILFEAQLGNLNMNIPIEIAKFLHSNRS